MDVTELDVPVTPTPASAGNAGLLPPPAPPQPPRARFAVLKLLLFLLLCGLGGAALGAVLARNSLTLGHWLPNRVSLLPTLMFGALMLWPHIVLHEAGHVLSGMARGMVPVGFGIGRLRWDRGTSGWRFRRSGTIAGISGYAALLPRGERGQSRVDQALYLLGGPLANLLTAAIALALLPLLADTRWPASFLLGTAGGALLIGLGNLLPFHSQGWRSDGRGLLDLLRHSPDAELQQRLQRTLALNMAGLRPRDWPEAAVPQPVATPSSPMLAVNGDLLRLSWATDRGDAETAACAARNIIAAFHKMPEAFRAHLAIAVAGYVARMLRDRDLLAAWRPLCEGGVTDLSLFRRWLDAELAALSGDAEGARTALADTRQQLDHAPDPVSALLLGEYLEDIERRLVSEERLAPPAAG